MASNNQLALSNTTSQARIRTNICFLKSIDIYVPDDNESVPYAFLLGMRTFKTAKGSDKALFSGYFSVLCAVLPDLTKVAHEILENLGFQVKEVMVPSQTDVKYSESSCYGYIAEVLSFAQLIYIPFTKNFNCVERFWVDVAQDIGIPFPIYFVAQSDVAILHSLLTISGSFTKLKGQISRSQQAFAATGTPFGIVFSRASAKAQNEVAQFHMRNVAYHL